MNHNRGGAQQQRIMKGSINYFPNRNHVGHPVEEGYTEYVTQSVEVFYNSYMFFAGIKKRLLVSSSVYAAPSSKSTLIKRNYSITRSLRTKGTTWRPRSLSSSVTVTIHKSTKHTPRCWITLTSTWLNLWHGRWMASFLRNLLVRTTVLHLRRCLNFIMHPRNPPLPRGELPSWLLMDSIWLRLWQ